MNEAAGLWVFYGVVAARLLIPLAIPKYPLPGILVCLVLDGIDQTIFQQFPTLSLAGYQGYDKAFDIYYLTIAYAATFRNWSHAFAFQVSRFLFYWRLLGVVLFELFQLRPLLLVFPNTFEYFFIFYEAFRLGWDPKRMTNRFVIGAAAVIWIGIKIPQEYWLHITQLDLTDFFKVNVFGAAVDTPWSEVFAASSGVCLATAGLIVLFLIGLTWLLLRRLPAPDHRLAFSADAHQPAFSTMQVGRAIVVERRQIVDAALAEKIILVMLIVLIFTQVLPGVVSTNFLVIIGVAFVVTINAVLSHWLARRGFGWAFSLLQALVLLIVNAGLFVVYTFLLTTFIKATKFGNAVFFIILLTMLITLFDRYRQVFIMRFALRR